MKTFLIANRKGGVGKSTTAVAVASILSQVHEKRTLLVDLDSQGSCTNTYRAKVKDTATAYDLLVESEDKRLPLRDCVQETEIGCIVASDPGLDEADIVFSRSENMGFMNRLRKILKANEDDWDYVVIDTAAKLDKLMVCALCAADEVIVPVTTDVYGASDLIELYRSVSAAKEFNPNLKIGGILTVMYEANQKLTKDMKEFLITMAEKMETRVYPIAIRRTVKVKDSQAARLSLIQYARACTAELDYEDFVEYLVEEGN